MSAARLFHQDARGLSFAPDGSRLAAASDGQVATWNLRSGARESVIQAHAFDAFATAFSPDGRLLVTAGWDHDPPWPKGEHDTFDLKLWDKTKLVGRLTGHTESVVALSFNRDGRLLASGSVDQTVRVWDLTSREVRFALRGHASPVHSIAFGPDALVSACLRTIRVWRVQDGSQVHCIDRPSTALALSPNGRFIASGDERGIVTVLDAATGDGVSACSRIKGWVSALTFAPDGKSLIGGALTGTLYVWDTATGRVLRRSWLRHWRRINSVQVSPDGTLLASAAEDGVVVTPLK